MAEAALATSPQLDDQTLLKLVTGGDCSSLSPAQKVMYYRARCDAAGLDYRSQPFAYMRLSGKEVLYALKAASDGLAAKHGIVTTILSQVTEDGVRVVTVRATAKDGRQTEDIGAVAVQGLRGEALCNALMKATTKAKRRATLSVCGLGMLDESELDTIPSAAQEFAQKAAQTNEQARAAITAKMPDNTARITPWMEIVNLCEQYEIAGDDVKPLVKQTTGKGNAKDLTMEDVEKVRAALQEMQPPTTPHSDA